jgi:6-phosphogluconolactonase
MNTTAWVKSSGIRVLGLVLILAGCGGGGGGGVGAPPPQATYTVGGTVTGLAGSGLVLRDNGGDDLPVAASGAFTFATSLANGAAYAVTASAPPTNPSQTCVIANGSGSVAAANVTTVAVNCTTNTYTLSVTVSGLTGAGLVLGDNRADHLSVGGNGSYTFTLPYPSGSQYLVWVLTEPTGPVEACTITGGTGVFTNANITSVIVQCAPHPPFARFAYAVSFPAGEELTLGLDTVTGQMTPLGGPYLGDSRAVAPTPDGRFVYVLQDPNEIHGYTVDPATGALTPVPGGALQTACCDWGALAIDPSGSYLYVSLDDLTIWAYSIDAVTGALTQISKSAAGHGTVGMAADPGGRGFVYAVDIIDNAVYGWVANSSTGALTPIAGGAVPAGSKPASIAIDSTGTFAYVANSADNTISGYAINPTSGALTALAGSPFPAEAGAAPYGMATSPHAAILYVTNSGSGSVGVFSIDATTGALKPIPGSPFAAAGINPTSIAIDPSGQFVYAVDSPISDVVAFNIDPLSGALAPLATGARIHWGFTGTPGNGKMPQAIAIGQPPLAITASMIYLADRDQVGTPELYQGATKLNPTFRPGTVVTNFALTADGLSLLYIADQDTSGVPELYLVSLAKPGTSTKLNSVLTAGGSVSAFVDFSQAASGVLDKVGYIATQDSVTSSELYLVNLATPGTSVKLNPKLAAGGLVGVESAQVFFDGTLVYRAQQDSATAFELYQADPAKPGTAVKLNAPLVAGGNVETYLATGSARRVVYRASQDSASTTELYVVVLTSPGVSKKVNAALVAGGNVQSFAQPIGVGTGGAVFYRADQDTRGVTERYLAASPGAAPVKLNPPLASGSNVLFFAPSASDTKVVYVANQDNPATFELYVVDTTKPGTSTKLNAPLGAGGNVQAFLYETNAQLPVLYLADHDTQGVPELYGASPATPGTVVKLNPPLHAGQAITHFDYDALDGVALYLSNQAKPTEVDLFGVRATAPGVAVRLDAPLAPGGNVEDFAIH